MRIYKFKTNRYLTKDEIKNQLYIENRIPVKSEQLNDNLSVITLNSTYLETVDKFYPMRGTLTTYFLPFFLFIIIVIMKIIFTSRFDTQEYITLFVISIILFLIVLLIFGFVIKADSFQYTHFPIRFNRKNKMVYVFTNKNKQVSIPWNKIHFSVVCRNMGALEKNYILCGNLLSNENIVLQSFEFGGEMLSKRDALAHWEFVRRYMENDIKKLPSVVEYCLPIAQKRGSLWYEFHYRFCYNFENHHRLIVYLFSPFIFCFTLGRVFAMFSSRYPKWSDEIESACQVDQNDPINLTSDKNLPWTWKDGWTRKHWYKRAGKESEYGIND